MAWSTWHGTWCCCPNPTPAAFFSSRDRKSTRLNSSHLVISYAVFCLKKKKPNPKLVLDDPRDLVMVTIDDVLVSVVLAVRCLLRACSDILSDTDIKITRVYLYVSGE